MQRLKDDLGWSNSQITRSLNVSQPTVSVELRKRMGRGLGSTSSPATLGAAGSVVGAPASLPPFGSGGPASHEDTDG